MSRTSTQLAFSAIGQAVRRPEQLALDWQAGDIRRRSLIIFGLLGTAAFGLGVYGAVMRMHAGPSSMLVGALRAPLAAGLAWAIALPALYIVGSTLGSRINAGTTLLAASVTVAFGATAMLAGVPIAWFFALAMDEPAVRLMVHGVSFAGVGICMSDVFLRVMGALEPEGGQLFRYAWLALLGVIGLELFILFNVFAL